MRVGKILRIIVSYVNKIVFLNSLTLYRYRMKRRLCYSLIVIRERKKNLKDKLMEECLEGGTDVCAT